MAHSYLEFRGNHVHLRDEQIFWLMTWIGRELDSLTSAQAVHRLLEYWENDDLKFAPGCIDIPLDAYLVDSASLSSFLKLLEQVETSLDQFGGVMPAQVMNESIRSQRFLFEDQPTQPLREVVQVVRQLLNASDQ